LVGHRRAAGGVAPGRRAAKEVVEAKGCPAT